MVAKDIYCFDAVKVKFPSEMKENIGFMTETETLISVSFLPG